MASYYRYTEQNVPAEVAHKVTVYAEDVQEAILLIKGLNYRALDGWVLDNNTVDENTVTVVQVS